MAVKKAKKKAAKVSAKEIAVGTTTEKYADVKFDAARIIALHKDGKNVSQIAQAIGYPKGHGNNRTRRVLVAAGLLGK
jgi:hypothetical protein